MAAIRKRWLRRVAYGVAVLIVTLAIAYAAAPLIVRARLEHWLKTHGEQRVQVADVDFNIFTLRMTVHALVAEGTEMTGLRWQHLTFRVSFWPLWKRRIEAKDVVLRDAIIGVNLSAAGDLIVGGLELGSEGKWEVGVDNVDLHNVVLAYKGPRLAQSFTVVAAQIDHLKTWRPDVPTRFHLEMKVAQGLVRVDGRAKPLRQERTTSATVKVEHLALGWLVPLVAHRGIHALQATAHVDLEVSTRTSAGATEMNARGGLGLDDLSTVYGRWRLEATSASFDGGAAFSVRSGSVENLDVTGSISARKLALGESATRLRFAVIDSAKGEQLEIAGNRLAISRMELVGAHLLETPRTATQAVQPASSYVASSPKVSLVGVSIEQPARMRVKRMSVNGLDGQVLRQADGAWQPLQLWPSAAPTVSRAAAAAASKADPRWSFAAGRVSLAGSTQVSFSDMSTTPNVNLEIDALGAELSELDTDKPEQASPMRLQARIGKYSTLAVEGTFSPFAPKSGAQLQGSLLALSLPELNGYLAQLMGYIARSGRLDTKAKAGVARGKVNAALDVTLKELQVEPLSGTAAHAKLAGEMPVPLPTALGLLRAKNGDIRLQFPISGELAAPKVHLSSVVQKAVGSAIKRGMLVLFAPLGAAVAIESLAGRETVLRLNPVLFPSAVAVLPASGRDYLQRMAAILNEHPDARVVLCGKATAAESARLQRPLASKRSSPAEGTAAAALRDLAQRRAMAVKDSLVRAGVAANRLYLCAPEIDSSPGAAPRVEVSM